MRLLGYLARGYALGLLVLTGVVLVGLRAAWAQSPEGRRDRE